MILPGTGRDLCSQPAVPGTPHPMHVAMEERGCPVLHRERHGRAVRRLLRIAPPGRRGLGLAMGRLRERAGEVMASKPTPAG
ncbi:hypothetical protein GCM10011504_40770 [Siccirubricoccus deserti]|nr:hypothetical protein GCM10011504_40770 [Siccirubricoccus deserti]